MISWRDYASDEYMITSVLWGVSDRLGNDNLQDAYCHYDPG
ncbi:MAG: hypothetical protein V7696_14005 [Halioglobus sp.]